MLSTYNYYPDAPTVVKNDDETVKVTFHDRFTRRHTAGRSKGAIEYTILNLHFDSEDAYAAWLAAADPTQEQQ